MDFMTAFTRDRQFFDGAMGTMLQAAGLPNGVAPETWNLTRPDAVRAIHEAYRNAGSTIAVTNTFGAYAYKLGDIPVEDAVHAAIQCARDAGSVYVALDVGPTGKLLEPLGELTFEDAVAEFSRVVRAGSGADCVLIETMSDLRECRAAVIAAKENCTLPVLASLTFDENGRLMSGADVETVVAVLTAAGADAIGVNCGLGPKQLLPVVKRMHACAEVPVFANPNAGLPEMVEGKTVFPLTAAAFANEMAELAAYCVGLGGCCGTVPEHIRMLVERCRELPIPESVPQTKAVIASASRTFTFGTVPCLIGERLNPTGKPKLKAALRAGNMDYLQREALAQSEKGVHALDVNVGLPGIDEGAMMENAVRAVQSVCELPLQIDTSSPEVMARGLRAYCGKALINSVSGKRAVMDEVFPIAKKYGGVLIALTLDDDGIPETVDGRVEIARKIVEEGAKYGIPSRDIIIDPLAMAVSAQPDAAQVALETIRRVTRELGVGTILGVSNISFGLPQRDNINAAFFTLALDAGLTAGIINPGSDAMRKAYASFLVLHGLDKNCAAYIEAYADAEDTPAQKKPEAPGLRDCIIRGLKDAAAEETRKRLDAGTPPMEIVDGELIPALDEVGRLYETGKSFLPQLLISADAAKAAFTVLRERMAASGVAEKTRGTIVLATVHGDIHDIGKNIAASVLENYRFDVRDLGKDVPPEEIVAAVVRENVQLCGLSALMTTTVTAMEETIRALRISAPWCKIMVGGAVLTEDYAKKIGADFYCATAMDDVRYAEEIFG